MHVPESAHKEDNIDPRGLTRQKIGSRVFYFRVETRKMSITIRDTISDRDGSITKRGVV